MFVPNYVPEPLEVPGNVTLERYWVRVVFIRRVVLLSIVSIGVIAGVAAVPVVPVPVETLASLLVVSLLALDLLRIRLRGTDRESRLSATALPAILILVGLLARVGYEWGFPTWAMAVGPLAMGIYTAVCGRDFSFVGGGVIAGIVSIVTTAAISQQLKLPTFAAAEAIAVSVAVLTYYVYDLASLMARRRRGEEWGAVVDLYRDIFNIFGFCIRCWHHWRKHRIFTN